MMAITTLSSREFYQDVGRAKRAAEQGPVIITDRGEPSLVVLKYEEYRRLAGKSGKTLFDAIAQFGPDADFDFEPPKRSRKSSLKIPDFDD
jgi:hypothetical protein